MNTGHLEPTESVPELSRLLVRVAVLGRAGTSSVVGGEMKGLLVEDDHAVAGGLLRLFSKLGLELQHVTTLAQARGLLAKRRYAFMILDRCLPDGDSIHLCRER